MSEEIFLPIEYTNGRYSVSSAGRVRSNGKSHGYGPRSGRMLAIGYTGSGYSKVTMSIDGKVTHPMVHRLVAMAFIPNPDGLPQVNHRNGVKTDNRVENLEWVTRSDNMLHALSTGLRRNQDGPNNHMAKLNVDRVRQILALRGSGMPQHKIAAMFGVRQSAISSIFNGKAWVAALRNAAVSKAAV